MKKVLTYLKCNNFKIKSTFDFMHKYKGNSNSSYPMNFWLQTNVSKWHHAVVQGYYLKLFGIWNSAYCSCCICIPQCNSKSSFMGVTFFEDVACLSRMLLCHICYTRLLLFKNLWFCRKCWSIIHDSLAYHLTLF